jgi:hypothetical protein
MGANIVAYIQFDDNSSKNALPFTNHPSTWDLSRDFKLAGERDYAFYAAICGVRDESGISPLFPCRGLPPNGWDKVQWFDSDDSNVSWLTLSEIHQALQHMKVEVKSLGVAVQLVLKTMQLGEDFYGRDRVRLVFCVLD